MASCRIFRSRRRNPDHFQRAWRRSRQRSSVFSAISAYLCDLCVKYFYDSQLTQRSQRYAEIAEKNQIVVRTTLCKALPSSLISAARRWWKIAPNLPRSS